MVQPMLDGKVAMITGGSSGIGQAAAKLFARYGARVVIADVVDGEATAQEIRDTGGAAIFRKTDVTHSAQVEALINHIVSEYGRLDCGFNNAGVDGVFSPTADCTEENWDRVMAVNLRGVWLCMKYQIIQMLKQGCGTIVNNASIAGLVGTSGLPAYVASKHGVVGLTKAAALEYARAGLRINAVCPGGVRTPMLEALITQHPSVGEQLVSMHPIGRLGQSEEVAEVAAWLCSKHASFVVGQAVAVDGGCVAI